MHAFEKILRAMAGPTIYHYSLFMQSYGPTYGNEEYPAEQWSDASGPLHVYDRRSDMPDDLWEHWNITDNYDDPVHGSQSYDINTWYKASHVRDWRYMGQRNYRDHPTFRGWALPRQTSDWSYAMPQPSAPISALTAPGPIVMGEVVSYGVVEPYQESPRSRKSILFSCPFTK